MISSLRLRNFKNFAEETLNLGPFTLIIGANASGKSNIRDSFRFLHVIGHGYRLAEIIGGKYGTDWKPIRGGPPEIARRRRGLPDRIEGAFRNGYKFFAENAWEEIETWVLAGLDLPGSWRWADVRAEVHVKETYFEPLAEQRGVGDGPGGCRKVLGREAARNIPAIRGNAARTSTPSPGVSEP